MMKTKPHVRHRNFGIVDGGCYVTGITRSRTNPEDLTMVDNSLHEKWVIMIASALTKGMVPLSSIVRAGYLGNL